MFLKHKSNGKLVEVLGLKDLFNPNHPKVVGRYNAGEELQDPEQFSKEELEFLSGEPLPRCWLDVHYRDNELNR
ncbi:MAG TPA: acetyltransferase [Sedimenticola sp.]|nr:acetyltransferase [Sedimenticola sp.]